MDARNERQFPRRRATSVAGFSKAGAVAGCLSSTLRRIESVGGDQRWREKLFGDEVETFAEGNLPERGRCCHFWCEHAKDTKTHTKTYALRFAACLSCLKMGHVMTCQRQAILAVSIFPTSPRLLFCTYIGRSRVRCCDIRRVSCFV